MPSSTDTGEEHPRPEIIRIGPLELRFIQDKHGTGGGLDLFEMVVPPGGQMPVAHYHRDWDEAALGLDGTVTFTVSGTPHDLGPGESLFIPRGTIHGFDNHSGAPARCLCVLTPGVLGPEYFRKLSALIAEAPPGEAPDEAEVERTMLRHGLVPVGNGAPTPA